jgi:dipeptide/tripeptide permease
VIYALGWALLYFVVSLFAFVCLPIFYRKRQGNQHHHLQPQRTISLQRYLAGSVSLAVIVIIAVVMTQKNNTGRRSIDSVFRISSLVFLLAYHLTEKEVRIAAKRRLFALFNIEEQLLVLVTKQTASHAFENNSVQMSGKVTQPPVSPTLPRSTYISVLPQINHNTEDD